MIQLIKGFIPNIYKRNCKVIFRNITDSLRYYARSGGGIACNSARFDKKISKIIFVCKGNVCRSAFAEHRLRHLLGHDEVEIDSCGVDVDQGNYPPADSVAVAAEYSCALSDRKAKSLAECDIENADLILPMEYWQYKRLLQLYPGKKDNIVLLRSIAPFPQCLLCNIVDPYGWGEKEFRRVFSLVDRALHRILPWC